MARFRSNSPLPPREAALRIVRTLRSAGHTAYFAGGCVRDYLLGSEPNDYDVATDARPERVRVLLPQSRYVGEAFGVVLVRMGRRDVEVATFRSEWGYSDKRRPDNVEFTDAEHDARRRDFTINGLFADPLEIDPETGGDRIIDYVGGRADLEARVVRAIGDPQQRFAEDYLRLLRAVRFASRLGFEIEQRTAEAISPLAPHLGRISRERIGQEVQAILLGSDAARGAVLMQQLTLDGPTLNESSLDVPVPTLAALDPMAIYPTRLAAWMIDRHVQPTEAGLRSFGEIAMFARHETGALMKRWRNALCLSNDQRDALRHVLALMAMAEQWDRMRLSLRKRLLAERWWPQALLLLRALVGGGNTDKDVAERVSRIEAESQPLLQEGVAPEPLIGGDDLIGLGLEPGPEFKRLLDAVYDAQLEGKVRSRGEALAWVSREASK